MGLAGLFGLLKRAHASDVAPAIAGVKLGDRVMLAGANDIALATEVAARAGLSGRVVMLAPDAAAARTRAARIEEAGALVEPSHAPLTMLPFDAASFDVAVAEERLLALGDADRRGAIAELFRVLRPGGRMLWIEKEARGGLFRLAGDARTAIDAAALERLLRESGFRGVRTLAHAQGKVFVEGTKAATERVT